MGYSDPRNGEFVCATPSDEGMIRMLGGESFSGVTFTPDQMRGILSVYKYDPKQTERAVAVSMEEDARKRADGPATAWPTLGGLPEKSPPASPEALRSFYEAGGQLHACRLADRDGLRMMAVLAPYLEAGEDPVKLLLRLMAGAGYDLDSADLEWALDEEEVDE